MIGKLIGTAIRVATLPVDALEIGADLMTGGDGSRRELRGAVPMLSELRDKVAETAEGIDRKGKRS